MQLTKSLDKADPSAGGMGRRTNDRKQFGQELVWGDENQERRVSAGLFQIRHSLDVVRKLDSRQVLHVLVARVDDFGQWHQLAIDFNLLFEHPHVHLTLAKVETLAVPADQNRNCASPITTSNDADLVNVSTGLRVGVKGRNALVRRDGNIVIRVAHGGAGASALGCRFKKFVTIVKLS